MSQAKNFENALTEYNLAIGLSSRQEIEKAIQHYKKAISLYPKFFQAHSNLGNLYLKIGDEINGHAHLFKALKHSNNNPLIANNLANIERKKGDLIEAERLYKIACGENNDSPFCIGYAIFHLEQGNHAQASALLKNLVAIGIISPLFADTIVVTLLYDRSPCKLFSDSLNSLINELMTFTNKAFSTSSLEHELSHPNFNENFTFNLLEFILIHSESIERNIIEALLRDLSSYKFSKSEFYYLSALLAISNNDLSLATSFLHKAVASSPDLNLKRKIADAFYWQGQLDIAINVISDLNDTGRFFSDADIWASFQMNLLKSHGTDLTYPLNA